MQDLESQDAVVESPDETEAPVESSPEEQIEAETEASTDADAEHLEVSEEEAPEEEIEAAAPEESPEPSEPEKPVLQPFSFTADRKRVDVEGASVVEHPDAEGNPTRSIVIPEATWQRVVQPHLADRGTFANKEREYKRQLDALSPDKNEDVIRAKTLLEEFERVLSSEENLTGFLENFEQNRELLKLKVEKAATEARLRVRDETDKSTQSEREQAETAQRIDAEIPIAIQHHAQVLQTQYQTPVSPRALQAAYEEIVDNKSVYYRPATEQEAQEYGVTAGELVRDDAKVLRTLYRFASLLNDGSVQKETTTEAAKKNAAALGKTKKSPPTVPAKGSPPKAKEVRTFETKEEWIAAMGGHV